MNKLKVQFVTTSCLPYRLPLFEALSKLYDLSFFFTTLSSNSNWNLGNLRYDIHASKVSFIRMLIRTDCCVLISDFPMWNSFITFSIMKIRRKKVIFWVEEWHQPLTIIRKLIMPFLKYMARHCDAVVVSGKAAKNHMLYYGASSYKIFVAPDSSYVKVSGNVGSLVPNEKFVILYLGRLIKAKGADYLIRAFSQLERVQQNVKLIIAGKGDFKKSLEQLVKDLCVKNVEFVEVINDDERWRYYSMCNLFVLPSIWQPEYCEAWGLAINEAMQFGKAIITTDAVGAAPDLVSNGVNGFIVRNRDSEALYQVIKRLSENPSLTKRMGDESKKIVSENYTWEKMVKGFEDAVASLYDKSNQKKVKSSN